MDTSHSPHTFSIGLKVTIWFAILTGVVFAFLQSTSVYASTLYVDGTLGSDSGNCQSSSCKTIAYAISQAANGDVINVSAGIYAEHLYFHKNLTINGAGTGATAIDQDLTAIPGIITVYAGSTVTITDVTVHSGISDGYYCDFCYGIYNAGDMELKNVIVAHNGSSDTVSGIGIQNWGNLRMLDSIVSDQNGQGIYNGGWLELNNIVVTRNRSNAGAGIHNEGNLILINSVVSDNSTVLNMYGNCGGIYSSNFLSIQNSQVIRNQSTYGGGICNGGTAEISGLNLTNNIAFEGGGILSTTGATLTIESTTISTNTATATGGGMSIGGAVTVTNSTISGNKADSGGAGIENVGHLKLVNVTISGNATTQTVGLPSNIWNGGFADSYVQLANTIINGPGNAGCASETGLGFISLGHNLSSDNTCNLTSTGDLTNTNPLLGPLQLNSPGTTLTHALLGGSPAVNRGSNAYCPPIDQRGVSRPFGVICDVGAFESENVYPYIFPLIFR